MPYDVFELSAINFGLVLDGRKSPMEYTPDDFIGEYGEAIRVLQKPGASKEDVVKVLNPRLMNDAHERAESMNGLGEAMDWRGELIKARQNYELGREFRRKGDALEKNEDVDLLPLYGRMTSQVAHQATGLTLASQIDYNSYQPFMLSGYKPIDDIIGGVPTDGPIVVYGMQGVGKSFFSSKMVDCLLTQHKKKTAAVYTLEMSSEHYLKRAVNMYPNLKTHLDRLYVSGSVRNIEELVAEVTTKRVDFVVVDDMDGMVQDESASEYQRVYKRIREICRFLKIPVMVLAQPNRAAKLGERFLRPFDISWSGAGENSAALLIALQVTNALDMDGDDIFPLDDDNHPYMIFWKSRDGWPKQQGPGAIRLDGCDRNQLWSGTPFKNRLWTPMSSKMRSIGDKKKK